MDRRVEPARFIRVDQRRACRRGDFRREPAHFRKLGRARRAREQVLLQLPGGLGGKLAVVVGVELRMEGTLAHGTYPFNFPRNSARPRCNRDSTVPRGICSASAISWYDIPSTSRSSTTSRNSTGSDRIVYSRSIR